MTLATDLLVFSAPRETRQKVMYKWTIFLRIGLPVCLSIYITVYLNIYLYISLVIHLVNCLSIYMAKQIIFTSQFILNASHLSIFLVNYIYLYACCMRKSNSANNTRTNEAQLRQVLHNRCCLSIYLYTGIYLSILGTRRQSREE